jgi:hypothetical protein
MPGRPPRRWFDDCLAGVEAKGSAYDGRRVCGAVWARKSVAEKRRVTGAYERRGRGRYFVRAAGREVGPFPSKGDALLVAEVLAYAGGAEIFKR